MCDFFFSLERIDRKGAGRVTCYVAISKKIQKSMNRPEKRSLSQRSKARKAHPMKKKELKTHTQTILQQLSVNLSGTDTFEQNSLGLECYGLFYFIHLPLCVCVCVCVGGGGELPLGQLNFELKGSSI